jgi:hypothetical protein
LRAMSSAPLSISTGSDGTERVKPRAALDNASTYLHA